MFEILYSDIGKKVKGLTTFVFVLETIGAIIIGLLILLVYESLALYGLLVMILGPVVAWISSLTMYALGELVDKTCENENNTRAILKLMRDKSMESTDKDVQNIAYQPNVDCTSADVQSTEYQSVADFTSTEKNTIICSQCHFEQPIGRKICWQCGAHFKDESNLNDKGV